MIGNLRRWTGTRAGFLGVALVVLVATGCLRGGNPHSKPSGRVAVAILVNPAYLPRVGPAPLRLCAVVQPETNATHRVEAPAPKPVVAQVESPVAKPQKIETPAALAPPQPVAKPIAASNAPAPPSGADAVISPQMFLKYFNSTNANASSPPPDFTPPPSAGTAGSRSSYSTSPP